MLSKSQETHLCDEYSDQSTCSTEKQNGMFASIIVVLPSEFTGGDAHLSHAGLETKFNTSKDSLTRVTVLSWYTDVTHEIKPITSGYRFALSYNLVHTTSALRPAVSLNVDAVAKLRHILLSWKQSRNGPEKLIYLLEHQYSLANRSGSALKGKDAHTVACLDALCKQLNFHLGLADLCHNVVGAGEDNGYGYSDSSVGMAEVIETKTTIDNLVDMDGNDIRTSDELDFDDGETIPLDLSRELEEGEYDDQEYEGYMGNVSCAHHITSSLLTKNVKGAGSLERCTYCVSGSSSGLLLMFLTGYRRTVLVIWPHWSHPGMIYDGADGGHVHAVEELREIISSKPKKAEKELADYLYRCPEKSTSVVIRGLCYAARVWKNLSLWKKAVVPVNNHITTIGHEELVDAVQAFGWKSIEPTLVMLNDLSAGILSRTTGLRSYLTKILETPFVGNFCSTLGITRVTLMRKMFKLKCLLS